MISDLFITVADNTAVPAGHGGGSGALRAASSSALRQHIGLRPLDGQKDQNKNANPGGFMKDTTDGIATERPGERSLAGRAVKNADRRPSGMPGSLYEGTVILTATLIKNGVHHPRRMKRAGRTQGDSR